MDEFRVSTLAGGRISAILAANLQELPFGRECRREESGLAIPVWCDIYPD